MQQEFWPGDPVSVDDEAANPLGDGVVTYVEFWEGSAEVKFYVVELEDGRIFECGAWEVWSRET